MVFVSYHNPRCLGASVKINAEPIALVRYAWALWNGGPGFVVHLHTDAAGKITLDDSGGRCNEIIRLGMRVRIDMKGRDDIELGGFEGD